jgi:hypothetical protein
MKNKLLLTTSILFVSVCLTLAQETGSSFLSPEIGFWSFSNKMKGSEYIRQDLASYNLYNGSSSNNLSSKLSFKYAGFKYVHYMSSKIGLSVGLRYTNIETSIEKDNSGGGANYFYFRLSQNGTETEFIRLTKIGYSMDCLGIPVEANYNFRLFKPFGFFLKAGIDFNYSINTRNDIGFSRSAMKIYKDEVLKIYGSPSHFNSYVYFGGGLHFRSLDKVSVKLELNLPAYILTSKTSTLENPQAGAGCQLSLLFPLNKSEE